MTLRSPSTTSPTTTKAAKKPPACDACKARRVLCHPQPNGLPCPRCVEKGVICKTSYVPRGRPRKYSRQTSTISVESQSASGSSDTSLVVYRPMIEPAISVELSGELVKDLYECFTNSPQSQNPLFQMCALKGALSSAAWDIDLLPPEARVLAHCVCALGSTVSFHSAIIGAGPQPESFTDYSVFYPGADLRRYGARRAPAVRALHERAINLACDVRIHLEVSNHNAASCFVLDSLEERKPGSRPWAVAYISHIRVLAESRNEDSTKATWSGYLMADALAAISQRKPILVTYNDQLLIAGLEPPSLENMFESLRATIQTSKKHPSQWAWTVIRPFLFHVIRLCREFYDKISGAYARRHPIAEGAAIAFISDLSIMQSTLSMLFAQVDFESQPSPAYVNGSVRSCALGMTVGYLGLVLALYREMEHRATARAILQCGLHESSATRHDRMALLRHQTYCLAADALAHLVRTAQVVPTLTHILNAKWLNLAGWAEFCLAEADAAGGLAPGRAGAFERIMHMLKLHGYAQDGAQVSALIERMEAHLFAYGAQTLFPTTSGLSEWSLTLDNSWMGMFPEDLGYGHHI
ncbi:hypothetical protein B0H15DRAFT_810166 [Mycena belliarum]|uniref:Zn(2)-C6 fungal-type domain-containing protein n=1 Tax=Mycena belliarum TaxID=1033014 RepID=A0AAD6UM77_9AGAR|nr:hypothetical protein B0H15DRAFT_810166 [Mycena belliae]